MPKNRALIIFIKTPIDNFVKTRLLNRLDPETVTSLYKAFLKDLHQNLSTHAAYHTWYAIAPEKFDEQKLLEIIEMKKKFLQHGMSLGERMDNAFHNLFSAGYSKIVIVGSDLPSLSASDIEQAFSKLDDFDCVLGPSEDGGYYLIALKKTQSVLFKDIMWSSDSVMKKTLIKAIDNNISVYQLPEYADIDTYDTLNGFYKKLKLTDKTAHNFPRHTWKIMKAIFETKVLN
jgi:rSAM/selenodomain-associated transferase 1